MTADASISPPLAPSRAGRRSRLRLGLAAGALALSLFGCATASTVNTLTLWHAWGGAELSALKTLIAQYREAHPEIEVMALQVPYDKLRDKYLRSAAANGGPDLVIGDADWSGKFAASELVLRTDELFSAAELSRFHPKALESLKLDGKMYAIPESRETIALYYNKKLAPKPPGSIEALFAQAPTIPNVQYGMVYNAKFYYAMGYFFGAGGRLFDAQGAVAVNSPPAVKTFSLFERMSTAKGMLTSPEYNKGDSLFKERQTAMIVNGPWALVDYQKSLGADLGVAMLPSWEGKPAATWVGVKCMMFNPNADERHRGLARDFALFATRPESQRLLSDKAGHIPSVVGVKLDPASPLSVFQAQADVGTPVSIRNEVSLVWEPLDKALRQVTERESTPDKALAEAQKVIQAKLEVMKEQTK